MADEEGPASPVATAVAVHALLAVGRQAATRAAGLGVGWLVRNQRADGSWDQRGRAGADPADDLTLTDLTSVCWPVIALSDYLAPAR